MSKSSKFIGIYTDKKEVAEDHDIAGVFAFKSVENESEECSIIGDLMKNAYFKQISFIFIVILMCITSCFCSFWCTYL